MLQQIAEGVWAHTAECIQTNGVVVQGDDGVLLVPMPDLYGGSADDPLGDYLAALELFDTVTRSVDVVVPGHGSVGDASQLRARIDADRAYVTGLRDGAEISDSRIGPDAKAGWEWVASIHEGQVEQVARRG